MRNFELIACVDADEMASLVVNAWLEEILAANRAGRPQRVALSGGRIANKLFALAASEARARRISFGGVHFFWADERCVLPSSPDSNFKTAQELLFGPLKIGENQIHRIRGEEPPEPAAEQAEAELRRFADGGPAMLDLVFLGMGEDGHVASLFPGQPGGTDAKRLFFAVKDSPKPPAERVTLGYAAIATASQVWVLASGAGKEAALRESLSPAGGTPLGRVIRSRSSTRIFTDIAINHL